MKKKKKKNPKQNPQETKTPNNPTPLINFRGKGEIIFRPNYPLPTLALHWRNGAIQILKLPHPLSLPLPHVPGRKQVQQLFVIPSPGHPHHRSNIHHTEHLFGIALHPFPWINHHNLGQHFLVFN